MPQKNHVSGENQVFTGTFQQFRDWCHLSGNLPKALTIGNFDGCHLGHQYLLAAVRQAAQELQGIPVVMTFDPHPADFFGRIGKETETKRPGLVSTRYLFTVSQKTQCFRELGIQWHIVEPFNNDFAQLSREAFVDQYVFAPELAVKSLIVGHDFRFGRQRSGDTTWLAERCRAVGVHFQVKGSYLAPSDIATAGGTPTNAAGNGAEPVSSSLIRKILVDDGDVQRAAQLLGHPYLLAGTAVQGRKLGRTIGFPTINLGHVEQLIPRHGVYACFAVIEPQTPSDNSREVFAPIMAIPSEGVPAVVNIGVRPTVTSDRVVTAEAHLLAGTWPIDSYGSRIRLYFVKRLRDEMRFASIDELKTQIAQDCQLALRVL